MHNDMESAPSLEDGGMDAPSPLMGAATGSEAFDVSGYLSDLDGLDIDEAAKVELLGILHDIMSHFVQMGFDLKDVDVCGQLFGDFADAASCGLDGVESGAFTAPETPDTKTKEDSR
jgi:hypothetical protein